jgi:hypothetical protein
MIYVWNLETNQLEYMTKTKNKKAIDFMHFHFH